MPGYAGYAFVYSDCEFLPVIRSDPGVLLDIYKNPQCKKLAIGLLILFVVLSYLGIIYWIPRKSWMDPTQPALHNLDSTFDYGYLRGLAGFVTGMLLYKAYESGLVRKIFEKDIAALLVIGATIFCLHIGLNDLSCIILFALLVYVFAMNNQRMHSLCNNRFAQYLGNISYSIYLVQFFPLLPLFYLNIKLPGVVYGKEATSTTFWIGAGYCLAYIIILIGFSSLSYFFVEKPCRKYINARWGKQQMPVYA